MIHKKSGLPSKGWLSAYLRKYLDQRVTFELSPKSHWHQWLVKDGTFSADAPVFVSAVYIGLWKRPENWGGLYATGPDKLYLRFSKVVFRQGDLTTRSPISRSHYDHKMEENEFELSEMRGVGWAETLQTMTPRLGHSPGRITYSEGSSGKSSPSKRELTLPPGGSDSLEDVRE